MLRDWISYCNDGKVDYLFIEKYKQSLYCRKYMLIGINKLAIVKFTKNNKKNVCYTSRRWPGKLIQK